MTDIALEGKWTQIASGDSFLLFDDNKSTRRTIVFATTQNMRDLANIFFCDGTFYTCPNQFYQIYSIHIPIDDVMTPVFIPSSLERVEPPTPEIFFTLIKYKIAYLGLVFSPTSAMADFETAVHNSIRKVFPDINTRDVIPLHPEYMEKSTDNRTSNTIPRKRRRQDFDSTSSNSTTYASCIS